MKVSAYTSKIMKGLSPFMILLITFSTNCFSQGFNHAYLLGYDVALFDTNVTSTKARLHSNNISDTIIPESRKLSFRAAQSNISDTSGKLILSTNGCWIANADNDTLLNGSGLNPGYFATSWCDSTHGIPFPHSNVFLPFPDDSTKYVLIHHAANETLDYRPSELYYTIIDMTLDSGLGGVPVNQKNIVIFQDTISNGIAACKHANGRDWWIVALKDSSDLAYKILLTPTGITSVTTQNLGVPFVYLGEGQPTFSPDGKKFAYSEHYGPLNNSQHNVRLFDFDRCNGSFSNANVIDLYDKKAGLGLSFSSNSKFLYACSFKRVFQINIDSLTVDTVAINDNNASPYPPFYTDFGLMYLAASGKIYISTMNSTIDLHCINYPDSAGLSCDVQQHSIHLSCYAVRSDVNHPNYYLGCDTTLGCGCITSIYENVNHDFRFRIYPNPITSNSLHIGYSLPQNKSGVFQIYDVTGKVVFKYSLPQWSNEQQLTLPKLANGIYYCVILSDGYRVSKKIALINE